MKSQINIIVTLQIEGLHNWPEVPVSLQKEVPYLKDLHRHVFHIEAKKSVTHDDRDIEIIQLKHKIDQYLLDQYYHTEFKACNFGAKSCEMLAKEIANKFDLNYCKVMEDGENGAEIVIDQQSKQIDDSQISSRGENITFICSYLCGGKSTLSKHLLSERESKFAYKRFIEMSDLVKQEVSRSQSGIELTRSALQDTKHLCDKLIDQINDHIDSSPGAEFIISGVRQPEILKAFPAATVIWIDTPDHIRFKRFSHRILNQPASDHHNIPERYKEANLGDVNLGIDQIKALIFDRNSI